MASISFGGLATGLDTGAIIQQLLLIESRPLQRLETQRRDLVSKQGQFDTFKSKLQTLADKFESFKDDRDTIRLFTGSTSDEKVATATAKGEAVPGQFSLNVTQLAKAQSEGYTSPFADTDTTTFSAGTVDITVDGNTTQVSIENTDTLENVRDKLNNADAGVRASIINDGTNFQLVVTSEKTGTDNAFSLTTSGFTGDNPFATQLNPPLSTAVNATLEIDGLSVTSQTNSVTEAVAGVTFELESLGTTEVAIDRDVSQIGDKFQELVEAFNDVQSFIDAQQDQNDVSLRSIKSQLRSALSTTLASDQFEFIGLSQLGIQTDAGGRLTLDRGDLEDALEQDFEGVIDLSLAKRMDR